MFVWEHSESDYSDTLYGEKCGHQSGQGLLDPLEGNLNATVYNDVTENCVRPI